ncbi:MAG: methyltransferase domain-containing protein [Bacteroidia bacterium]|nr:methyltransferase domain-containing protein [Bacteroidia bacterium]
MTDRERWNEKYRNRKLSSYKSGASDWLLEHEDILQELEKGSALDIASGFGRNSFYLEKLGFQVDAVDVSDLAIDWLNEEAKKDGLNIQGYQVNLAEQDFPQAGYQVIICFNFLFRELFPKIIYSLKEGGLLFYETVYTDDHEILGNKMNTDYVLQKNELLHAFRELRILSYREKIVEMKSGRKKALASLLAKKGS